MDPNMLRPTPWERLVYQGRVADDKESLGNRYQGSVSLEFHILQMRSPKSFIHRSIKGKPSLVKKWADKGREERAKEKSSQ